MATRSRRNFMKKTSKVCEVCNYKKYPEILTLHHLFPRRMGKQPDLSRRERYLIVCPNCHALIERAIINDKEIHINVLESTDKKEVKK